MTTDKATAWWPPPFRHVVEVESLSLWLDGREDEAREVLASFTGLGVADFARKLTEFRGAVLDLYDTRTAELQGETER